MKIYNGSDGGGWEGMCIGTAQTGSEGRRELDKPFVSSSHGRDVEWRREGYQKVSCVDRVQDTVSPEKKKREREK